VPYVNLPFREETARKLRSMKEKLERERGGKWSYSDVVNFLVEVVEKCQGKVEEL